MSTLPPGQRELGRFPRFGMTRFARRFPREPGRLAVELRGPGIDDGMLLDAARWAALPRRTQTSDFHCVTTWSRRGLAWQGVAFADLYDALSRQGPALAAAGGLVVFVGSDSYRAALPLADLLAADVLLADRLDGAPLPLAHGAPLRLVAPAHYGYKSVKHLRRIEFGIDAARWRPPGPAFITHPRARVALEERGRGVPGWLLRWLYRPLIRPTAALFARTLADHERGRR
jgi:DMSO/TMAO reductase YedYZ molybdopterin-dependent catalytic subunit